MKTMNESQGDAAFLDIAANLLAIILIVTVFSLLTIQRHTHSAADPDAVTDPPLPFDPPQRDLFPPFSRFFFVFDDRIAAWDQKPVVAGLMDQSRTFTATIPQGRYQWLAEPLTPRDIDTYRLNFFIDREALLQNTPAFDAAAATALTAELSAQYAEKRMAPVFIVYPSGMDTFAGLYPLLEQARLRFRWFALAENAPLYLGRYPAQFTDYGVYW